MEFNSQNDETRGLATLWEYEVKGECLSLYPHDAFFSISSIIICILFEFKAERLWKKKKRKRWPSVRTQKALLGTKHCARDISKRI